MPKVAIDQNTTIGELLRDYPETYEVLQRYLGMCVKCAGSGLESLEFICEQQGCDVEQLLEELRTAAGQSRDG